MDKNSGYEIKEAVAFDDDRGFALGTNPELPSPYATWQFTDNNGKRDYYWGHYFSSEKQAQADYISRIRTYREDMTVSKKPSITMQLKNDPCKSKPTIAHPKSKGHDNR